MLTHEEHVAKYTAQWQKEMHTFVEKAMKADKKISYQDATNAFLLNKIADVHCSRIESGISDDFFRGLEAEREALMRK